MAYDDIVVGGGHNGLTAATYLARAGRRVLVLEKRDHVGGAAVSAEVFAGIDARLSRYAYLVSLMPREIIADLDLDVRLVRRRYASYTPVPGDPSRGVLVDDDDPSVTAAHLRALTGDDAELGRWRELSARLTAVAGRLWPTMLRPLISADAARAVAGDDELWHALTVAPLGRLLDDFLQDDLVQGIVATDGLIGTFAALDDPCLVQNVCFLYHVIGGGTGDWDVPVGGMGAVTGALARAAVAAGVDILTDAEVVAVDPAGEVTWRVGGATRSARAPSILAGCAPAVLDRLLSGAHAETKVKQTVSDTVCFTGGDHSAQGAQLKVNMLLTRLPRLRDPQVDPRAAFAGTFHVNESRSQLERAHRDAMSGRVPALPPCDIYCHTLSDRTILGDALAATEAQTLTLFGLHMPAALFVDDNEARRDEALAATLRSLNSVLAEPIEPLLMRDRDGAPCIEARTPVDLERDLDLPGGNIFHRPLRWPWAERPEEVGTWGVETRFSAIRVCGAGARRGGGVSGIPGHNAARSVLDAFS